MKRPYIRLLRRPALIGFCAEAFPSLHTRLTDRSDGVLVEIFRHPAKAEPIPTQAKPPIASLMLFDDWSDAEIGRYLYSFSTLVNHRQAEPLPPEEPPPAPTDDIEDMKNFFPS